MQRLYSPFVTEVLLTSTPLVKDVIEIIQTYAITLYDDGDGRSGLCIWEGDQLITIGLLSDTSFWKSEKYIYVKSCFCFEPTKVIIGRTPFFLGQMHINNLFLYRVLLHNDKDDRAVWTISSHLDSLLLKMSPEHFQQFLLYQQSRQVIV